MYLGDRGHSCCSMSYNAQGSLREVGSLQGEQCHCHRNGDKCSCKFLTSLKRSLGPAEACLH
jgi:hypothetical protein